MTVPRSDVRPSPLAGRWYPADSGALTAMIERFLDAAQPAPPPGKILGLMVPHAGLMYSGPVAAHAFKLIQNQTPDIVAVISPSHRPYDGTLLTTAHDAYQTPLGTIPVARDAVEALAERVDLRPVRKDQEHSLEIELPFLQHVLSQPFSLLPVMIMEQTASVARQLGHALAEVLKDQNALIIASSDLSHFYSQNIANVLDQTVLAHIEAYDPSAIFEAERTGRGFACGRAAIAAVMWAAQELGADSAAIVNYATSGDTAGNYSKVVGYGAGVFFKRQS